MTMQYSKEVKKNFMNPKNLGEIKDADGIGKVGNPTCGDVMWLYIKVERRRTKPSISSSKSQTKEKWEEYIKDIKFKTFGCAAAIATSSMITQLAKGKTLKEAEKITRNDVAESLKGLPPIKMHCSNLSSDALKAAIKDYENKKKNGK